MPAKASRSDVLIASGCAGIVDVERELLEGAAGELGGEVEADSRELVGRVELVRADRDKGEEVIECQLLGGGDVLDRWLFVVVSAEVDVTGRPRRRLEPKLERERALEHPAVRCDRDQAAKEELEGDLLT